MGGLIKNAGGKGLTKVPFLGDIPILGKLLFTNRSDTSRETNVVIYLTPYIVRRSDELQKLKRYLEELEQVQKDYNDYIYRVLEKGQDPALAKDLSTVAPVDPEAPAPSRRIKRTSSRTHTKSLNVLGEF